MQRRAPPRAPCTRRLPPTCTPRLAPPPAPCTPPAPCSLAPCSRGLGTESLNAAPRGPRTLQIEERAESHRSQRTRFDSRLNAFTVVKNVCMVCKLYYVENTFFTTHHANRRRIAVKVPNGPTAQKWCAHQQRGKRHCGEEGTGEITGMSRWCAAHTHLCHIIIHTMSHHHRYVECRSHTRTRNHWYVKEITGM